MKIINVVGARPNFMKIAPIIEAISQHGNVFEQLLVHTGQHYDARMSRAFFEDLGLPRPDINLGVGSGTHAEQTGKIMIAFEKVCLEEVPDLVLVVGDVNSTMACTITAKKLGIRVAHVEAGLRSFDMGMPEEINRLCTDVLCDLLFTTDRIANANLRREGLPEERIHFVGNVMIDTLLKHRERAAMLPLRRRWGLEAGEYGVLTLHRPSNVDDRETLAGILEAVAVIAREWGRPVVFPVHPRTRACIERFGLEQMLETGEQPWGVWVREPLSYLEFLHLTMSARIVLTDSGGLQEETTVLGVPCLTLRPNTERPIACEEGTNRLVGNDPERIRATMMEVLAAPPPEGRTPEKWDGKAAARIAQILHDMVDK